MSAPCREGIVYCKVHCNQAFLDDISTENAGSKMFCQKRSKASFLSGRILEGAWWLDSEVGRWRYCIKAE